MASLDTAHSMSVLTNSSVKPPVNPHSGLSMTIDERSAPMLSHTWHGRDEEHDSDRENRPVNFSKSVDLENELLSTAQELQGLTDDEFYSKLQSLRVEQQKTLDQCQRLYNETTRPDSAAGDRGSRNVVFSNILNSGSPAASQTEQQLNAQLMDEPRSPAKPPPHPLSPTRSSAVPQRTRRKEAWRTASVDETYWRAPPSSERSSEVDVDRSSSPVADYRSDEDFLDTKMAALSKINTMWDDFQLQDYLPRGRSSSFTMGDSKKVKVTERSDAGSSTSSWRHRITIPQPFDMIKRETARPGKTRTRAMQELERQREERERQNEAECQKKFKATPVPAHVYMPLYDELTEERETKARYNREFSTQKLQDEQKPFNFTKREAERHRQCRRTNADVIEHSADTPPKVAFRARPYPEHLFTDRVDDRMLEEEEYRKIRVKMRAEELLRNAALPPTMASRGEEYFRGKSRQQARVDKLKKHGLYTEPEFKPKVNKSVPDFERMHKKFTRKLTDKKNGRPGTVCRPFNFHGRSSPRHKIYDDIERDEQTLRDDRWRYGSQRGPTQRDRLVRSVSTSMDSLPTKMTSAAELRQSSTQARLRREAERELQQLEGQRARERRERELRRQVASKAASHDHTGSLRRSTKDKIREHKKSEREREKEYQEQLREIQEKVASRPLLFERETEMAARLRAERRYRDTLRRAGVDEDFLARKGAHAQAEGLRELEDHDSDGDIPPARGRTESPPSLPYTDDFDDGLSDGDVTPDEEVAPVQDELDEV